MDFLPTKMHVKKHKEFTTIEEYLDDYYTNEIKEIEKLIEDLKEKMEKKIKRNPLTKRR